MFTSLKTFLHSRKPPALYINTEGERFVVMGVEEYEHISGESAESLQTIDPVRDGLLVGLNNANLENTVSNGVDSFDTLGNTNESPVESRGEDSDQVETEAADSSPPGGHATELTALRLEEEIGVDDLPL